MCEVCVYVYDNVFVFVSGALRIETRVCVGVGIHVHNENRLLPSLLLVVVGVRECVCSHLKAFVEDCPVQGCVARVVANVTCAVLEQQGNTLHVSVGACL